MLLILVALGLALFGLVRFGRTLEPGQRWVLTVVFILGVIWLGFMLVNAGLFGRATE